MAYQRPFLVSLKKGDPQQPWGFRIFGGKEYGVENHVVEKIVEGSIAERAGLREGDEIIQIGRNNIQDLSFGQAQDLISRCGNKLEMFIIREDLLSPRKGKEPSHVKAVVHNPYNSPLNLYSTENIADTLARQTEVLTEGHILTTDEEEEGPENLSFKQKSAVFQLLEEQARQESTNQYQARGSPQRKVVQAPPPKPQPPAVSNYQNKENFYYPEQQTQNTYSTTVQSQTYRSPYTPQGEDHYSQVNSVDYRKQEQRSTYGTTQTQQNFSTPQPNRSADLYQTTDQRSVQKVTPVPPPRSTQPSHTMTTVYRQQQQQPQFYEQQNTQQYQEQHDTYQTQKPWPPPQPQVQQKLQVKILPQPSQEIREPVFEQTSTSGTPISYKAPPSQRYRINWPPPPSPTQQTQQNGVWSSPSPTPASPSKANIEALWPPRQPPVKELPRTGFNPAVVREQSGGRRCVWPPPKTEEEFRSGRTTPQSPMMGRKIQWNPSPSPPSSRRSPFGSVSPVARRKDIIWPPPQPVVTREVIQHRPSPTCTRRARFDDHVKLHAGSNVPITYRAPPGTQHVEFC